MAHLAETITALKKGAEKMTVAAGVKTIEMWERELKDVDGTSTIITDLGKLKNELQDKTPDGKKIKELMGKLSSATTKAAAKAGSKKDQVEELGTCLDKAA